MPDHSKARLLIFVVAYNAEKTIDEVLFRIPASLSNSYRVHVLIIDDSSADSTFARSNLIQRSSALPFPLTVLTNPVNQGYGGNQKIGYHYAIENQFDFVALIHGDGQYAPECLPGLLEPFRSGEAAAVFGSRMIHPSDALRGGMPKYKFAGNRILTVIQNKLLRSNLSEYHSGYRIYSTQALAAIPFDRNSNNFHFDTEIIIQLMIAGFAIREIPIPTYYGDEICRVNGIQYAGNVVWACIKARLQHAGLFYDRKFDCGPENASPYTPKLSYPSPHSMAFDRIPPESRVLDIGCAGGYLGAHLATNKHCAVDGIDACPVTEPALRLFRLQDLNAGLPPLGYRGYDYVVMLDVIEHLAKPESFLDQLRAALSENPGTEVLISTANVGFFVTRLMLLFGQFNYGRRGILDLTHTRLFTFSSFERTIEQAGFYILERVGVPGPYPLALGDTALSRMLIRINQFLIPISRGLFSYQIFLRLKPRPGLAWLLRTAEEHSAKRAEEVNTPA
jgi:2-polyprenyl-3-methyl-5-hydroxy-6-metoxy-1,4-benzoquinol methylase